MRAKVVRFVVIMIGICIVLCAVNVYCRLNPEHLIPYFEKSLATLVTHANGTYLPLHRAPLEYKWLQLFGFTYVDARIGIDGAIFGFDRLGLKPEESFQIEYYINDQPVHDEILLSSLPEEEYRINDIGMGGAGYISLVRVKLNWLLRTTYLPT